MITRILNGLMFKLNLLKNKYRNIKNAWEDPVYFTENYVKIISLDEGLIPFKLYEFQRQMMWTFHTERFTICKLPRQSGKSTTIIAYLLHFCTFQSYSQVSQFLQTKLLLQEIYLVDFNLHTNTFQIGYNKES